MQADGIRIGKTIRFAIRYHLTEDTICLDSIDVNENWYHEKERLWYIMKDWPAEAIQTFFDYVEAYKKSQFGR